MTSCGDRVPLGRPRRAGCASRSPGCHRERLVLGRPARGRNARTPRLCTVVEERSAARLDPKAAAPFFAPLSSRYERSSIGVTSHRTFSAQEETLGNPAAVATLVDRLVHRAEVRVLCAHVYRLQGKDRDEAGVAERSREAEGVQYCTGDNWSVVGAGVDKGWHAAARFFRRVTGAILPPVKSFGWQLLTANPGMVGQSTVRLSGSALRQRQGHELASRGTNRPFDRERVVDGPYPHSSEAEKRSAEPRPRASTGERASRVD